MMKSERINLKIRPDSENVAKVTWGDSTGSDFLPYGLYIKTVQEIASATRAALNTLSQAYLQPTPDFSNGLKLIAEKGNELREALFRATPPENTSHAAKIRDWFEKLAEARAPSITVTVHADPILQVPWGLLHDGIPSDNTTADIYGGFWALRYDVATIYGGMEPQTLQAARQFEGVKLLSALNQEVFETTKTLLDSTDQNFIDNLLQLPVGKAFSTKGCSRRWQEVGDNDCLIYFFGHASGTELRFSERDLLSAYKFRTTFRRESPLAATRREPMYVFTFLNGCATVAGQDSESFLVATADPGFCGFVGAEAPVPDRFALLFGHDFLCSIFFEGRTVLETMRALWRKHKPMALLYGCYAHPEFRVASPTDPSIRSPRFETGNLSYDQSTRGVPQ
jgi:hypothetical protein